MKKTFYLITISLFIYNFGFSQGMSIEDILSISKKKGSGDYVGAIDIYSKHIKNNPNDALAYEGRGSMKAELGDHRGALVDYTKSIDNWSTSSSAHLKRGISKLKLRDYSGSIEDFSKAIDYDRPREDHFGILISNAPEAYYYRGLARVRFFFTGGGLDLRESGCLDLSKAGELGYSKAYEGIRQFCNY